MAANKALGILLDHVYDTWKLPAKYAFWADFFPSILINERSSGSTKGGQAVIYADSKCSRYHRRDLHLLRRELERNAAATLDASDVELPEPLLGTDEKLYRIAWYVRWIVRSPLSQSREHLLNPAAHEDPFDDGFVGAFAECLREDFSASVEETDRFRAIITSMRSEAIPDRVLSRFVWPERLDNEFVKSARRAISYNVYADLFAMLFLASLYGPMDYRWEFGYLNKRIMTKRTLRPTSGFEQSAKRNGILRTYAMLTRVTYDEASIDERDYITCSEAISLKDLNEVRIGRSLPSRVIGDTAYISLENSRLEVLRQAEVSKLHARLARSNGAWVLRDWDSKIGTLVVTRSGERFVVGGDENETKSLTLSNGDILCFGHSDKRAVADLPCYLFHVCASPEDTRTRE